MRSHWKVLFWGMFIFQSSRKRFLPGSLVTQRVHCGRGLKVGGLEGERRPWEHVSWRMVFTAAGNLGAGAHVRHLEKQQFSVGDRSADSYYPNMEKSIRSCLVNTEEMLAGIHQCGCCQLIRLMLEEWVSLENERRFGETDAWDTRKPGVYGVRKARQRKCFLKKCCIYYVNGCWKAWYTKDEKYPLV